MKIKTNTSFIKYFLIIAIIATGCWKNKDKQKDRNEDEIKSQTKAYVEAFNNHDADKLASLFVNDGIIVNFSTKETVQGKDEIIKYFKNRFENDKESLLKISKGKVKFKDLKNTDGEGIARVSYLSGIDRENIFRAKYVKQDGVWLIQKVIIVEDQKSPSHFDKLKELQFFVGNWLDQDEDIDMKSNFKWRGNKNFLVQTFSLKIVDVKQLRGKQIIGWDPVRNKIRSWIFDSDGGFGVSHWKKKDNSWYVSTVFVLPDGRKATSTNIYTIVDENTYTFSSISREVDGNVLPDIGPFTVVRKK